MKFDILIENTIKDLNEELKKEKNMNYIKYELLNPLIEHIVKELYPYFLKIVVVIITRLFFRGFL